MLPLGGLLPRIRCQELGVLYFQSPLDCVPDLANDGRFKPPPFVHQFVVFDRVNPLDIGEGLQFEPRDTRHFDLIFAAAIFMGQWHGYRQRPWRVWIFARNDDGWPEFASIPRSIM